MFNVTGKAPLVAERKLLSAALVAVSEHVPLALITLTVVPATEQPVPVETKLNAPVPLPPEAVAVPVVP